MYSQKLLIFATILISFSLCCGYLRSGLYPPQKVETHTFCGQLLSRALSNLCYRYVEPQKDKPTIDSSGYTQFQDSVREQLYKVHTYSAWPVLRRKGEPRDMRMANYSDLRRYLGSVCCEKPCRVTEIMTYC